MGFFDDLKNILTGEGKNKNIFRNIIILGMVGTLFLLFGNVFLNTGQQNDSVVNKPPANNEVERSMDYQEKIAAELEEVISLIKGVGRVKVKIYVKEHTSYNYEYNESIVNKITSETDQNGGRREIEEDSTEKDIVITRDAAGNEKPVVTEKKYPEISGIMIVAEGGEISGIKYRIIKAVKRLFNIPLHKISILPYERR